ncbi:MAG: HAD hydrolase-like protein [Thermoplasmata archaeon]|nr:HAD hydrolase-like protein [Thermoplasmata archaeon]
MNTAETIERLNPDDCVIITDLDGTLIDSDKANFQLLLGLLKKYNFDHEIETIMNGLAEGVHFNDIMVQINMPVEIRNKMDTEMEQLLKLQDYNLLPDVRENLDKLKQMGFIFAIVTDNYIEIAMNFLTKTNILDYFDSQLLFGSNNFTHQKPSEKIIEEIFKRSGRRYGIIVGNSSKELEFAKKANLPIIILNNFAGIDSKDPVIIYYQRIRQISDAETYTRVFKSESWNEINEVITNIITKI